MKGFGLAVSVAWVVFLIIGSGGCAQNDGLTEEQLTQFNQAQALYRSKKFQEAEERLNSLREARPDSMEVAVLFARIKFFTREFAAAEAVLVEQLESDADNPYVLMWLGKTIAVDPERQEEAAEKFRLILERDPENYMAHYYLGRVLESQRKIKPALLEYQTALGMEYQISKVHLHMGRLFHGLRMNDRAQQHFGRVREIDVNPNDMELIRHVLAGGDDAGDEEQE